VIYLDSSAVMKVVRAEEESDALREWLVTRADEAVVTSELGRVEVLRAAGRLGAGAAAEARAVLGDVDLVPLDRAVQDLAAEVGGPLLRTLDAVHLASALVLGDAVSAVVCYDVRLADAARAAGLTVATPAPAPPPSAPEA